MNDFDDRLSRHLEAQARTVDLPGGDLGAVVTRARKRRQHRRIAAAGTLAVVAGVVGATVVTQRDERGQGVTVGPEPQTAQVEPTLRWAPVEPGATIGWATTLTVGADGELYALSTAPGPVDPNKEYEPTPALMYRSTDGVEWSEAGVPGDLWASSLDAGGGRLYAVGTGPAAAAEGEPSSLQVASSTDGGGTWSNVDLPFDVAEWKARFGDSVFAAPTGLAVSPDGAVLATVVVSAFPDPSVLLPADVDQRWGVLQTATGFDVYGPPADLAAAAAGVCPANWVLQEEAPPAAAVEATEGLATTVLPSGGELVVTGSRGPRPIDPGLAATEETLWCVAPDGSQAQAVWPATVPGPVARSFTWDELGVEPELQALYAGKANVFLAADGATFESVDVVIPGEGRLATLEPVSTPDGFALLAGREAPLVSPTGPYPDATISVLASADGRTWTPHPAGDLSGYVRSAGAVAGQLAVVVDNAAGTQLAVTSGGPWAVTTPGDLVTPGTDGVFVSDIALGPLGAVAVIGAGQDPVVDAGGVDVTAEGYTLHIADSKGGATVTDASGTVVAETATIHDDSVADAFVWNADYTTLTVVDPATGQPLVSFDAESVYAATDDLYRQQPSTTWSVAYSADGVAWSVEPLGDLLGEAPDNASAVMTPTAVVVRAEFHSDVPGTPARQVALVGTPA